MEHELARMVKFRLSIVASTGKRRWTAQKEHNRCSFVIVDFASILHASANHSSWKTSPSRTGDSGLRLIPEQPRIIDLRYWCHSRLYTVSVISMDVKTIPY